MLCRKNFVIRPRARSAWKQVKSRLKIWISRCFQHLKYSKSGIHRLWHWHPTFSKFCKVTFIDPKIKVRLHVVEKRMQKDGTSLARFWPPKVSFCDRCYHVDDAVLGANYLLIHFSNDSAPSMKFEEYSEMSNFGFWSRPSLERSLPKNCL
jgi:hypothetical protein